MMKRNVKVTGWKSASTAKVITIGAMFLLASSAAFAADPLGDGVCKLVTLLTGKWLFGFTILATLGAGAALLFGGEITDGLKKIATIISIVGIILATSSILTMVFGSSMASC